MKTDKVAQPKNVLMHREIHGILGILAIGILYLSIDISRQLVTYAIRYYSSNEVYPMPHAAMVGITELIKFAMFAVVFLREESWCKFSPCVHLILPALIHAINNNLFFVAVWYAPLPLWNIFMQMRIVLSALVYKFKFEHHISNIQWAALCGVVTAIVGSHYSKAAVADTGPYSKTLIAAAMAVVVCVTSMIANIKLEFYYKNDTRSFSELQVQIYFWSSVFSGVFYIIDPTEVSQEVMSWAMISLVVCSLLLTSCVGVLIAVIVKKLDIIVKLYTQALSGLLTSLAFAILFPLHFTLSPIFFVCLILMIVSVIVYETQNINNKSNLEKKRN